MKRIVHITLFALLLCAANGLTAAAQIGQWKNYMAYSDIQQIRKAGDYLFVMASNSLYQYNINDGQITTYDKTTGLSDAYITNIAWNPTARRLIVAYDNSNIDLVETNGNVTNIADLYLKTMTGDKTINSIYINGKYAYLATNFGAVKIDMAKAETSEAYILDVQAAYVAISGTHIYIKVYSGEVWQALTTANLLDKANWSLASGVDEMLFQQDTTDYDEYIETVESLSPGGPKTNYFGYLKMKNRRLYAANGGTTATEIAASLQMYDGTWHAFNTDITEQTGHRFVNIFCVDEDPTDPTHVFAGGQTGLYEYRNYEFVKEYTNDNSPLETAVTVSGNNKDYVIVTALGFDNAGNLWLANSLSPTPAIYELSPDGTWTTHRSNQLYVSSTSSAMVSMRDMMFDSRGILWFGDAEWRLPALVAYYPAIDSIVAYSSFVNQDGTTLAPTTVSKPTEDLQGNIWMATNIGPLYVERSEISTGASAFTFQQFKIPRNDGTSYADYLLNNISISAIAIDGAGRKWFGTSSNGVYLISADNMTQEQHFTSENSPLLSDIITDIAIDNTTGEVFIGTERGLCSYMSDATAASSDMDSDNVYAYPNPVGSDYTGLITVVGLSLDADVKIATANGHVVYQGRSNGGTFTWNGCDTSGERVVSGVYNVLTAKSDGSKGTVCKIAIVR